MAGKLNKSTKQILSVLFHLVVLVCMVLLYDTGVLVGKKLGWIEVPKKEGEANHLDFMEHEETLSTEIDPELRKLVKKEGESYVFRRDLKAPPHLKVVVTEVSKYKKVRVAGISEFHDGSATISLREDEVMEYEMAGRAVRVTMRNKSKQRVLSASERMELMKSGEKPGKKTGYGQPDEKIEEPDKIAESGKIVDRLVGKAVQFNYDGRAWKTLPTKAFSTMAWGKNIEESLSGTLVANGLLPRPRWFGTKPMKFGDTTKLANESLILAFDDAKKGSLEMVFKGVEGVHGHPCGVFEVEGAIVPDVVDNEKGQTIVSEITIERGRIWFSLLHPVVLRMDFDTIQSIETRETRKLIGQLQGEVEYKRHLDWKAVAAQPRKAPVKK